MARLVAIGPLIGNKKAVKQILREVIAWQKAHDYLVTFFAEASPRRSVCFPRSPRHLSINGLPARTGSTPPIGRRTEQMSFPCMGRDALRDGYLRVLHALYDPKAYFARVDALFLEAGLQTGAARHAHLRSRPLIRLIQYAEALLNSAFIFFKLQTAVEAALRHHYRRVFFNVVRRRPEPFVLQAYALKASIITITGSLRPSMPMDIC
jgi:hypothetical protein